MRTSKVEDKDIFITPKSIQKKEKILRLIQRSDKGLVMAFYPSYVLKDYSAEPKHKLISRNEQTRRFGNEILAYQRFMQFGCPHVPKLIDFSVKDRWLCIEHIPGFNLLQLLQSSDSLFPLRSILTQIDDIAKWLVSSSYPCLETNIKDIILSDSGKIYIVDFEAYSFCSNKLSRRGFYNGLVRDILDRIIVHRERKARLHWRFIIFSLSIVLRTPLMSTYFIFYFSAKKLKILCFDFLSYCKRATGKMKSNK